MYRSVKRKCSSFHSIWLLNAWWEVECPLERDFVLLLLSVGSGRAILVWYAAGDILEITKNISPLVPTLYDSKNLQKICIILNFINYTTNFIDKYNTQSTAVIFHEREIKELATSILKKYKLEIHENPEHYEHVSEKHIINLYITK